MLEKSNPNEQFIIQARVAPDEPFRLWVNLSSIQVPHKNKYQLKWSQKIPAYNLFDVNGTCIADVVPLCRRRAVFVPLL
jgi:hypothetical protein